MTHGLYSLLMAAVRKAVYTYKMSWHSVSHTHTFCLRMNIYTQKGTQARNNPVSVPPQHTNRSNPNPKHFSLEGRDKHPHSQTVYIFKWFILCRLLNFLQIQWFDNTCTLGRAQNPLMWATAALKHRTVQQISGVYIIWLKTQGKREGDGVSIDCLSVRGEHRDGDTNKQSEPFANLENNYYCGSMYFFQCVCRTVSLSP